MPSDGGGAGDAASDGGTSPADMTGSPADLTASSPDFGALMLQVNGAENTLEMDSCQVSPALLPNIPGGTYTITLTASTLSKGSVSISPPVVSVDNYVLVSLPLPPGDPQADQRVFMLNGIGASATFTLTATGTVEVMFLDSDTISNNGQATVTVQPGNYQTTVDALANVLAWRTGCNSTEAQIDIGTGMRMAKLVSSTLTLATGDSANYVILRIPNEEMADDFRYVVLNGIGSSYTFNATDSTNPLRAWLVTPTAGSGGMAMLRVSTP